MSSNSKKFYMHGYLNTNIMIVPKSSVLPLGHITHPDLLTSIHERSVIYIYK